VDWWFERGSRMYPNDWERRGRGSPELGGWAMRGGEDEMEKLAGWGREKNGVNQVGKKKR